MPRVSVIIPTHNRAHLVCETIDSVLAQTDRDFEVIVVDDGSADDTPAVLAAYGDRIRIIRQPNQGLSSARNAGIGAATGEFVAFLDSDDLWVPTKLEQQMARLDADPGLAWVYSDAEVFDSETGCTSHLTSQLGRLYQGDVLAHLILGSFIATPTPVVRRAIFDEMGAFYDNKAVAEDWDMWLRIAARYPIQLVDKPLARYRLHAGMKTLNRHWRVQQARRVRTIERAVAREPERLGPLRNQAIANLNTSIGRTLARKGDLAMARNLFGRAIRLAPGTPKTYAYWLGCLIGGGPLRLAMRVRRQLQGRKDVS